MFIFVESVRYCAI